MINGKTLIVILNWNDYLNTVKCIKNSLKQTYKNFKILLIDNNSSIKIYNLLKKKFNFQEIKKISDNPKNKLLIYRQKINLGCGMGHNFGLSYAIKHQFQFVSRIDNDIIFDKNFLSTNINLLDKYDAVSPIILYPNKNSIYKKNTIWWQGTKINNNLKLQKRLRDSSEQSIYSKNKFSGIKYSDAFAGCICILKTKIIKKTGLNDINFFYGPEDVELSYRYKKYGKIIVNFDYKVFHHVSQSFKNFDLKKRQIYYEYKYRLYLLSQIGSFSDKFCGYMMSIIKFIGICLFFLKFKYRLRILPIGKALIDFYIFKRLGQYDRTHKSF